MESVGPYCINSSYFLYRPHRTCLKGRARPPEAGPPQAERGEIHRRSGAWIALKLTEVYRQIDSLSIGMGTAVQLIALFRGRFKTIAYHFDVQFFGYRGNSVFF